MSLNVLSGWYGVGFPGGHPYGVFINFLCKRQKPEQRTALWSVIASPAGWALACHAEDNPSGRTLIRFAEG